MSLLKVILLLGGPALVFAPAMMAAPKLGDFINNYCLDCHDEGSAKGEIVLEKIPTDFSDETTAGLWSKVLEQVAFREMPPRKKDQPSIEDRSAIISYLENELKKAGHPPGLREKLQSPEYGNYVDHRTLFDGSIQSAPYTPSRLWKRSPDIFDSMLIRGFGLGKGRYGRPNGHVSKIKQPFTIEDKVGVKDFAPLTKADSATLGTMMRNAEALVDKLTAGAFHKLQVQLHGEIPDDQLPKDKKGKPIRPRFPGSPKEFEAIILDAGTPTDAALSEAIRKMFELVIERPPSEADLGKYRSLIRKCIEESDNGEGLRVGLIAIAISPDAIYRPELGSGDPDQHGRRMLAPTDLAYALSYALTDEGPDEKLLAAIAEGNLAQRDDIVEQVERLWDDSELAKPRILRFFHEFFDYHHAPKVFKDTARFKGDYRSVPDQLVTDADTLVRHIVSNDKNVFEELLTTEKYFVAHSGDNELEKQHNEELKTFYQYLKDQGWADFPYATPKVHADKAREISRRFFSHPNGNVVKSWMKYLTRCDENGVNPMPLQNKRDFIKLYNLDEKTFDYPVEQPFVLAKEKRIGILMHPAWLLSHSLNLDNDPVRRGKWIRERLLAGTIPELPITVDASIPEDPHLSLRERFYKISKDDYCWRCHVRMNPLGMPFETFDDFGRHRNGLELLHGKGKSKPVDSSGVLVGTDNPSLDGDIEDPVDMIRRIARSDRARQSFVRHAFRYWMGRNETLEDSPTLIAADKAYLENGGSFRALVISLLTSDSFLYRKSQ
ncbi:MAG: DUF1588 domain-containing protein [Akkermansiaceae bacterium]